MSPGVADRAGSRDLPRSIGIVGAGQLARMACEAASALGIRSVVLAEHPDDAATATANEVVLGVPTKDKDLRLLAERCDVVTFDHELVDLTLLSGLVADGVTVRPGLTTLEMAVDKAVMRSRLVAAGLPVPAPRGDRAAGPGGGGGLRRRARLAGRGQGGLQRRLRRPGHLRCCQGPKEAEARLQTSAASGRAPRARRAGGHRGRAGRPGGPASRRRGQDLAGGGDGPGGQGLPGRCWCPGGSTRASPRRRRTWPGGRPTWPVRWASLAVELSRPGPGALVVNEVAARPRKFGPLDHRGLGHLPVREPPAGRPRPPLRRHRHHRPLRGQRQRRSVGPTAPTLEPSWPGPWPWAGPTSTSM